MKAVKLAVVGACLLLSSATMSRAITVDATTSALVQYTAGPSGAPGSNGVFLGFQFGASNLFDNGEIFNYQLFDQTDTLVGSGSITNTGAATATINPPVGTPFVLSGLLSTVSFKALISAGDGSFDLVGSTSFVNVGGINLGAQAGVISEAAPEDVAEVPIPGALPLFLSGLGALSLVVRRRRKQSAV
jgi:hypothetical protein